MAESDKKVVGAFGFPPYQPEKGEEYMNENQLQHFTDILNAWKMELMSEVDRTVDHMKDEAANFPDPADRATQEEEFSIEEFSKEVGMSRHHLHKKLKALVGKSPSQYVRSVRLHRAKELIEEENGNISEIAYNVGFSSPAYFSRCFKTEFGYPPSDLVN